MPSCLLPVPRRVELISTLTVWPPLHPEARRAATKLDEALGRLVPEYFRRAIVGSFKPREVCRVKLRFLNELEDHIALRSGQDVEHSVIVRGSSHNYRGIALLSLPCVFDQSVHVSWPEEGPA